MTMIGTCVTLILLAAAQVAPESPAAPRPEAPAPAVPPTIAPGAEVPGPSRAPAQSPGGMPAIPTTPASPLEVLAVQPFTVATPFPHRCRADGGPVTSGFLVVLRADPGFVVPRQVAESVPCAGSQSGERLWSQPAAGLVLVMFPAWSETAKDGTIRAGDPRVDPVWFAAPELPERVNAAWIASERNRVDMARTEGRLGAYPVPAAVRASEACDGLDDVIRLAGTLLPRPE
jgi:hypothetical protein